MVATLQLRKDALEAKIQEKTSELKQLCLQEAELTGVLPPETPLNPGEEPPPVRRRVGTSFSFPQSLINSLSSADDASLNALELECKVQTNIAEAALTLANDASANKAVRRKHRLMYRQSQRRLIELETRLSLLKQGKHQPLKLQQIKKKPRPTTTTIDHTQLLREIKQQKLLNYGINSDSWPIKTAPGYYVQEEADHLAGLHRSGRSSRTSQSSNSPKLSSKELAAFNSSGLPKLHITSSLSQPNIQDLRPSPVDTVRESKKSERRSSGRRQWDTQSAGGTLLPSQTYPENHQPNLNRTQSLGSVDGNRQSKEKEWYETCLDSAPSPPLRTSSRLPSTARMMYHMQEMQIRDAVNRSLNTQNSQHLPVTRTHAVRATPIDEIAGQLQNFHMPCPSPRPVIKAPERRPNDAVYIDIPEDQVDSTTNRRASNDDPRTPTQPFYHTSPPWQPSVPGMHPPHAATLEEITFDTVVPFESPQNHTVVQAGVWQPYREVTKPFEMSDFYKYSTKFRQARQSPCVQPNLEVNSHASPNWEPNQIPQHSPSTSTGYHHLRNSEAARRSPSTHLGVYQPLRPMTCQPIDARSVTSYFEPPEQSSVSSPKMV